MLNSDNKITKKQRGDGMIVEPQNQNLLGRLGDGGRQIKVARRKRMKVEAWLLPPFLAFIPFMLTINKIYYAAVSYYA